MESDKEEKEDFSIAQKLLFFCFNLLFLPFCEKSTFSRFREAAKYRRIIGRVLFGSRVTKTSRIHTNSKHHHPRPPREWTARL